MDLLPVEIWREIFWHLRETFVTDRFNDPLKFFAIIKFDWVEAMEAQSERFQLLTICKFLRPVAEEIVYSDVFISTADDYLNFIACTRKNRQDRRGLLGSLTNALHFLRLSFESEGKASALDVLPDACPNLSLLHFAYCNGSINPSLRNWTAGSLSTLIWTTDDEQLPPSAIFEFKNLTNLHLAFAQDFNESGSPQTLPVKKLSLLGGPPAPFDLEDLTCPSLEWLSINIISLRSLGLSYLVNFLQRHRNTLIGLEIIPTSLFHSPVPGPPLFRLPKLETLILPELFKLIDATLLNLEGNPRLHTLMLRAGKFDDNSLDYFIEKIKPRRLPQLKRFVLLTRISDEKYPGQAREKVLALSREFPSHVVCECQDDHVR